MCYFGDSVRWPASAAAASEQNSECSFEYYYVYAVQRTVHLSIWAVWSWVLVLDLFSVFWLSQCVVIEVRPVN